MKILILHHTRPNTTRKTVLDHLYSFKKYDTNAKFHYCNVFFGIPFYLFFIKYDAIILHYSLLGVRSAPIYWKMLLPNLKKIKKMTGMKVAIPQDDMYYSSDLCSLFKEIGVLTIYTAASPKDYEIIYPSKETGVKNYFFSLTGFVDLQTLHEIQKLSPKTYRPIDIGYRGNKLPYNLGRHGQIKTSVAEKFLEFLKGDNDLNIDISIDPEKVFFGNAWLDFLMNCRTVLGCLGGSSLHDPNGEILKKVSNYISVYPHASFEEVENNCFKGLDYNIELFATGPRHLEAAMTKTCQVLVEGDYKILRPNIDYIEIKKDFSNLDEVIAKVKDHELCRSIAENAYQQIVMSEKFTYNAYAKNILEHIKDNVNLADRVSMGFEVLTSIMNFRERNSKFLFFFLRLWLRFNVDLEGPLVNKLSYVVKLIPIKIKNYFNNKKNRDLDKIYTK